MPDLDRARLWLNQHRLGDTEPTPLLAARLGARREARLAEVITVGVCAAGIVALMVVVDYRGAHGGSADVGGVVWQLSFNIALILGLGMGFWWQHRAERPLLAGMTTRNAHPAATSAVRVLGPRRTAAAVALNGGGLAVGAVVALLASSAPDRALALAFLVGIAVLATLNALSLTAVLRRPSLAEDSASLAVDDRLRVEDAKRAVTPYPLVLGLVAALDSDGLMGDLAVPRLHPGRRRVFRAR